MDLTELLQEWWKKTNKLDPLGHKAAEAVAKQDSRIASEVGRATGWDWLRDQGKRNQQDPSRALAHGAQGAALAAGAYYAWPALMGSGAEAAPATAGAVPASGMFANAGGAGINAMTQEQLMQQALQQAAMQQAAEQGGAQLASQGMFNMVPGVTNGSQQAAMLAEQNAGMGGTASDLTAQAAKPAVQDAYTRGGMSTMDYAQQMGKADLAGMNDPNVWLQRLARNGGRLAGNAGKSMATQSLMQSMAPQQARPASMPTRGGGQPQQKPQVDPAKLESLKQRAISGDQMALQELLTLLGGRV